MRSKLMFCLMGIVGLSFASPVLAQTPAAATGGGTNWVAITSGFAMALAAAFCALAQGKAASSACEGVARNPGARPAIQLFLVLSLIFIESLSLYTLLIIFAKVTT